MTYEEFLEAERKNTTRRKPGHEEHDIQVACVKWFRDVYEEFQVLLFAVPNGGRRDKVSGAKLKAEGVRAGVSDLILLVPNRKYYGLLIEMKKPKQAYQSVAQKDFEVATTALGYKYVVCRSLEDFQREVNAYMAVDLED